MNPAPLLEAQGLTVRRPAAQGEILVLDGVSLTVRPGEVVDVSGSSGSGKSTLLLALARLLPSVVGHLALDGRECVTVDPRDWRRDVLYVPQVSSLRPGTLADALLVPWTLEVRRHETPPSEHDMCGALAALGLADLSLRNDSSQLSVGQASRVALARGLLANPRVLLVDEPDASLDERTANLVDRCMRAFASKGGGVVRSRHRATAADADRLVRVEGRRLCEVKGDA